MGTSGVEPSRMPFYRIYCPFTGIYNGIGTTSWLKKKEGSEREPGSFFETITKSRGSE